MPSYVNRMNLIKENDPVPSLHRPLIARQPAGYRAPPTLTAVEIQAALRRRRF